MISQTSSMLVSKMSVAPFSKLNSENLFAYSAPFLTAGHARGAKEAIRTSKRT